MACHCAYYALSPSPSPQRDKIASRLNPKPTKLVLLSSLSTTSSPISSCNSIVSQAVRLLGPPARFEASKLKVIYTGKELDKYSAILPRTYTLSHCDFTANLTLTISSTISLEQLKGWYKNDDVVAEWKKVNGDMCLHVHCYVSGPNSLAEVAAEFRYHIFSKELPLVLQAVIYGDSLIFRDHPELMDALVRVYFHSSSQKFNRIEYWGPLKDAAEEGRGKQTQGLLPVKKSGTQGLLPVNKNGEKLAGAKNIFRSLFAFLLSS